ncbi:hypothetical protein L1276_003642 [Flavobacterium sp. HSC-32F16]|uniref:hypothetical protein n=1 Tax=Flavobacterium sp. HSC-32F16 TaxID=2910964 RepID=UPI0020A5BA76|nr:hypothetical protein [Flavobacterium sp. HSC-32F16]MCP2028472.1 hypothetical protein [Flavobacterium sp. HSC-32F16]
MKYIYKYILIILTLFSCQQKEPIIVEQIISKEVVTILPNLKNPFIKDSVVISIPVEFKVTMNSTVDYVVWLFRINNKTLWDDVIDYQVYKKQNKTKPIYQLDSDKSLIDKPIGIIIKERNHLISKTDARKLLRKYNQNRSLDNLKFGDTIKLVTYDKFRKENKILIDDFEKVKDSIHFKAVRGEKENFYVVKKINW